MMDAIEVLQFTVANQAKHKRPVICTPCYMQALATEVEILGQDAAEAEYAAAEYSNSIELYARAAELGKEASHNLSRANRLLWATILLTLGNFSLLAWAGMLW